MIIYGFVDILRDVPARHQVALNAAADRGDAQQLCDGLYNDAAVLSVSVLDQPSERPGDETSPLICEMSIMFQK
jgi:hypothetical protein